MIRTRTRAAAVVAAASLALAACGGEDAPAPADPTVETEVTEVTEATEAVETTPTGVTAETTEVTTEATDGESFTSESPSTTVNEKETETLEEVRERFSVLAPAEFFDRLDGCVSADLEGYYDCAGEEVGQFQFFDSESKAASTTQVLTELRSSKIVEDDGDRVVGWSTVGTSAIVTVVDNKAGQVMQHLVSTDREDPRQRIYDLGLAKES